MELGTSLTAGLINGGKPEAVRPSLRAAIVIVLFANDEPCALLPQLANSCFNFDIKLIYTAPSQVMLRSLM